MKISIEDVAVTPPHIEWSLCVFGEPRLAVKEWAEFHGFALERSGRFTNIIVPSDVELMDIFETPIKYDVMDGFSPNLNKHLHIGHLSNLVIAKAFVSLGIARGTTAIYGDTLTGAVSQVDAELKLDQWMDWAGYRITEDTFYASDMSYNGPLLVDGTGKYEGTKGFNIGDEYVVGIKSDGSTSYFYQDVCLADGHFGYTKLYLTGSEQSQHFSKLSKLYPEGQVTHVPLGLVTAKGKKMSSRDGKVIMGQEVYDLLVEEFPNPQLAYNVFAGFILNSTPKSQKKIDMDSIADVKNSPGLYLSYTLARLQSAGMKVNWGSSYSHQLSHATLKAQFNRNPKFLMTYLMKLARVINGMYVTIRIMDNPEGQALYQPLLNDLATGMSWLGIFMVKEV
jgi:arginyl-tRNA synthetase